MASVYNDKNKHEKNVAPNRHNINNSNEVFI